MAMHGTVLHKNVKMPNSTGDQDGISRITNKVVVETADVNTPTTVGETIQFQLRRRAARCGTPLGAGGCAGEKQQIQTVIAWCNSWPSQYGTARYTDNREEATCHTCSLRTYFWYIPVVYPHPFNYCFTKIFRSEHGFLQGLTLRALSHISLYLVSPSSVVDAGHAERISLRRSTHAKRVSLGSPLAPGRPLLLFLLFCSVSRK